MEDHEKGLVTLDKPIMYEVSGDNPRGHNPFWTNRPPFYTG